MLLDLDEARLLTRPVLRGRVSYLRRRIPVGNPARSDGADAVLLSHLHLDRLELTKASTVGEALPPSETVPARTWHGASSSSLLACSGGV